MPTVELEPPTITHTQRRGQNRYSDDEQAQALAALDANDGQVRQTARELDIPEATLREWRDGKSRPIGAECRARNKSLMSDQYQRIAVRLLERVDDQLDDMSGAQAMLASAIAVDKMLLLRGEMPGRGDSLTVNVTNNTLNVNTAALSQEALQEARQLLSRASTLPATSEGQEGAILQSLDGSGAVVESAT